MDAVTDDWMIRYKVCITFAHVTTLLRAICAFNSGDRTKRNQMRNGRACVCVWAVCCEDRMAQSHTRCYCYYHHNDTSSYLPLDQMSTELYVLHTMNSFSSFFLWLLHIHDVSVTLWTRISDTKCVSVRQTQTTLDINMNSVEWDLR